MVIYSNLNGGDNEEVGDNEGGGTIVRSNRDCKLAEENLITKVKF